VHLSRAHPTCGLHHHLMQIQQLPVTKMHTPPLRLGIACVSLAMQVALLLLGAANQQPLQHIQF
jgi:hypothetical protein